MALKHLVEPECGGSNPLMQWSSNFIQGRPVARGLLQQDKLKEVIHHGIEQEDDMVREFLQGERTQPMVPQTFNMSALLQDIPSVPQITHQPRTHQEAAVNSWIEEFGSTTDEQKEQHLMRGGSENQWVDEFSEDSLQNKPQHQTAVQRWIEEFSGDPQSLEAEKWVQEFESENDRLDEGISKVAKQISSTVTDPQIQESEGKRQGWDAEFLDEDQKGYSDEAFWSQLEESWSVLKNDTVTPHPWLKDYEEDQKYKFIEDNPMKSVENPLEKGLEKLHAGDLPSAVLYFEATVQQNPESIDGWQYLGISQAHNEQDVAAVAALEKCLQLDPGNLPALQGLAVSYTNEALQSKACQVLRRWLKVNPKYSNIVPEKSQVPEKPFMHSFMSSEEHKEVTDLYLQAARQSINEIDPDVQVGLGVLYNLSCEYDRAVDCFTAALQVKPNDAMLWNKLGATQANSNRSEEAIHAYRQALELAPGLTRSRYNLGISCINLRAYREAIEHFLMALNLQQNADTPQGMKALMSQGIWSTLRLALVYENRHDLLPLVDKRQLEELMKEFGI